MVDNARVCVCVSLLPLILCRDCLVLDSTTPDKFSRHVIFRHPTRVFQNNAEVCSSLPSPPPFPCPLFSTYLWSSFVWQRGRVRWIPHKRIHHSPPVCMYLCVHPGGETRGVGSGQCGALWCSTGPCIPSAAWLSVCQCRMYLSSFGLLTSDM